MAVQHFDIDDQWNPNNIAEAQREREAWYGSPKEKRHCMAVWDAMDSLPCDYDDEAVEVK